MVEFHREAGGDTDPDDMPELQCPPADVINSVGDVVRHITFSWKANGIPTERIDPGRAMRTIRFACRLNDEDQVRDLLAAAIFILAAADVDVTAMEAPHANAN
jgi:hypothetical protein